MPKKVSAARMDGSLHDTIEDTDVTVDYLRQ